MLLLVYTISYSLYFMLKLIIEREDKESVVGGEMEAMVEEKRECEREGGRL